MLRKNSTMWSTLRLHPSHNQEITLFHISVKIKTSLQPRATLILLRSNSDIHGNHKEMEMVAGKSQQRLPPFMQTTRKNKVWQLKISYRLNLIPSAPQLAALSTITSQLHLVMISTTMFQTSEKTEILLILRMIWIWLRNNMVGSGSSALENLKRNRETQLKILCMTSSQG